MFLKKDLEPYTVFTPFKNNVLKHNVEKPNKNRPKNLVKVNIDTDKYIDYCINKDILVKGGRDNGLKQLNKIKNFKKYDKIRNMVEQETTHLSAYIKFDVFLYVKYIGRLEMNLEKIVYYYHN